MYNYIDLHIHSNFSWDSSQTIDDILKKAKEKNIKYIGMTEHLDFHYNHPQSFMHLDYEKYTNEILKKRENFYNLLKGIEVGEPYLYKGLYEKYIENKEFDMIIASVHWIGNLSPVGDKYFFSYSSFDEAYKAYLDEEYKLIKYGNFDVAAHLTLMHRRGAEFYKEYSYFKYKKEIDDILKELINKNIALEVNASGLRHSAQDIIPDKEIIKAYIDLGGDLITVGSDSHQIDTTFFGIDKIYEILDSLNVNEITIFKNRKIKKIPLKVKNE